MKRKLKDLNYLEYQVLKQSGMLWEIYPEASGNYYEDIKEQL